MGQDVLSPPHGGQLSIILEDLYADCFRLTVPFKLLYALIIRHLNELSYNSFIGYITIH